MNTPWQYLDHPVDPRIEETFFGFVYKVTEISTGRIYYGSKRFSFKTTKKPLKGRVNKRRGKKPSDWQTYTTSSTKINELVQLNGINSFKWEILKLVDCAWDLQYEEALRIIESNALRDNKYFNDYIRMHLGGKKPKL